VFTSASRCSLVAQLSSKLFDPLLRVEDYW
jgi:hypothetical protein